MITINQESKIAPTWFKSDRDRSGDVEWLLKPLTGLEFLQVQAGATVSADGYFIYNGQSIRDALRFGIQGWKGVVDEKGDPINYNHFMLDKVPQKHLNEVFNEIINRAFVSENEQKN